VPSIPAANMQVLRAFVRDEGGATAIEYVLLAAVVAIAAIAGLVLFANANNEKYSQITSAVAGSGS
jgi:pilus assembly protein Flp/PilA